MSDLYATALTSKYAPRSLTEIVGQPAAVQQLRQFVGDPHSAAFIFHGPTGVGKTAAARALAFDLGCADDFVELGGLSEIPSGKQDGRAVDDLLRGLRLRPLFGSGWKVAIVNEADCMTDQAEAIWLDGLEHLPGKSVVVFTTNDIERLSQRLVGRCELVAFAGEGAELSRGLGRLARRIWKTETQTALRTLPANLGRYELAAGNYSIRLALQQLAPLIRQARSDGSAPPAALAVPFIRGPETLRRESAVAAARKAVATRRRRHAVV